MNFKTAKEKSTFVKLEVNTNTIPEIIISNVAANKMYQYIQQCKKEVGWLGKVEKKNDRYFIKDVDLIEQTVTGVSTELKEDSLQKYFQKIRKKDGINALNEIRLWGHSHVDMSTSPSNQDEETFEEYYNDCSYFIRLIGNKKGEMKIDLADKDKGLIFYDLPFSVECTKELFDKKEMYKQLVESMNVLSKEIEDIEDKEKEKYVDVIEKEIKNNVKEELSYKKYQQYSQPSPYKKGGYAYYDYNDYYGCYGYDDYGSYGYDDYGFEEEVSNAEKLTHEEQSELKKKLKIKVKNGTGSQMLELNKVFKEEDIEEIAMLCSSPISVSQYCEESDYRLLFSDYKITDWRDLYESCISYYEYCM